MEKFLINNQTYDATTIECLIAKAFYTLDNTITKEDSRDLTNYALLEISAGNSETLRYINTILPSNCQISILGNH
jgi:hypothetical protein